MKKRVISFILTLVLVSTVVFCRVENKAYALSKKDILNSAELSPLRTGVDYIDELVDNILDSITTDDMSTYEKTKACYDYIIHNFSYGSGIIMYDDLMELMGTYSLISERDVFIAFCGYDILSDGEGVCGHYASAFMLLTRAIGLESYVMGGKTNTVAGGYAGHRWVNIIINGTYYSFDPQVEDNITDRSSSGKIGYYRFCSTDKEMEGKLIYADRQGDIDEFCNFEKCGEFKATVTPNKTETVQKGKELVFNVETENVIGDELSYEFYMRSGNYPEFNRSVSFRLPRVKVEGSEIKWTVDRTGEYTMYFVITDIEPRVVYKSIFFNFVPRVQILINGDYVEGIPSDTVEADCPLERYEKIVDSSGNRIDSEKKISTGDKFVSEGKEYTIVVKGDIDCNGILNSTDYITIKKAFLGDATLEGACLKAADTDGDGILTSSDYTQVKKHFLGNFDIYE